jgi:nucleoside-diphosphate-sugar epimerase
VTTGLVGGTGYVGGTIARQRPVDRSYHRPDLHEIRGQRFARLYLAGAPAQKWVANGDPEGDAAALAAQVEHLRHVQAQEVVLISTVDVYPRPVDVDERTPLSTDDHEQAYGRNRLWLEHAVREVFSRTLVLRLPGLFGTGLRKNLVYDLLHEREEFAHRDSVFQFYDLSRLCDDADAALEAGLDLVNLATAPVSALEVAREVFGRELVNEQGTPARYDMRTRHAQAFGGSGPYVADRPQVLAALQDFVSAEREGTS